MYVCIYVRIRTYVPIYVIHTYAMRHGIVRRPPWILLFFLPFPRPLSPAHAHHEEKYGWLARLGFLGPEGRVLNKGRRDSLSADLRIEKDQGRVADRRLRRKGS